MNYCKKIKSEVIEQFAEDYRFLDNKLIKESWNKEYELNSEKLYPSYTDLNLKMISIYCSRIENEMTRFTDNYKGRKVKVIIDKLQDVYKKIEINRYQIVKLKTDLRERNKYYTWEINAEIVFMKNYMFDHVSKYDLERKHGFSELKDCFIVVVKLLEDVTDRNKNILYYKGDMLELYSIHRLKNLFEKYEQVYL